LGRLPSSHRSSSDLDRPPICRCRCSIRTVGTLGLPGATDRFHSRSSGVPTPKCTNLDARFRACHKRYRTYHPSSTGDSNGLQTTRGTASGRTCCQCTWRRTRSSGLTSPFSPSSGHICLFLDGFFGPLQGPCPHEEQFLQHLPSGSTCQSTEHRKALWLVHWRWSGDSQSTAAQ